jgi:hypothetical protein
MLELEWNALRPGDRVLVHDDTRRSFPLHDAVVIGARSRRDEDTVRVASHGSDAGLARPRRLAVHLAPLDGGEACWRCTIVAARDEARRTARGGRQR